MVSNQKMGFMAAAVIAGAGMASAANAQFSYSNFNSTAGLSLNGVATSSPGLTGEQMTLSITPPVRASAGSFFNSAAQNVVSGFTTDFHFRIRDRAGTGSDGLTFMVQAAGLNSLGGPGGALGFGTNLAFPTTPSNTGIANSVAVVFDTWDNSANWPTIPGANVITVQSSHLGATSPNTPSAIDSLGGVAVSGAFNDGATHLVRVAYTPGIMSIFYDNLATPALTVPINLASTLNLLGGSDAFVGFTAGTGALINIERHEIRDWSFNSVAPAPGAAALLGLGGLIAARRRRS